MCFFEADVLVGKRGGDRKMMWWAEGDKVAVGGVVVGGKIKSWSMTMVEGWNSAGENEALVGMRNGGRKLGSGRWMIWWWWRGEVVVEGRGGDGRSWRWWEDESLVVKGEVVMEGVDNGGRMTLLRWRERWWWEEVIIVGRWVCCGVIVKWYNTEVMVVEGCGCHAKARWWWEGGVRIRRWAADVVEDVVVERCGYHGKARW